MKDEEEINLFEKQEKQLHVFLAEFGELAKKRPNDAVNKFKLGLVNSSLVELNKILGDSKPFSDFVAFELDQLPTNSDLRLMLAQYAASAYSHRTANTKQLPNSEWFWIVGKKTSNIHTTHPNRFEPPE